MNTETETEDEIRQEAIAWCMIGLEELADKALYQAGGTRSGWLKELWEELLSLCGLGGQEAALFTSLKRLVSTNAHIATIYGDLKSLILIAEITIIITKYTKVAYKRDIFSNGLKFALQNIDKLNEEDVKDYALKVLELY